MKTSLIYLCLFLFAATLLGSCKKDGELIEAKSYGTINISAITSAEVGSLLVDIDGKVIDTLKAPSAQKTFNAYTGNRKLKVYQPGKESAPVIDTVLNVAGNTATLDFLYTGDLKLVGNGYDGSVKPATGNSLVQFVNLEKLLPALVTVKVFEIYSNDNGDFLNEEVATINNVAKNKFSSYAELPPLKHGDYSFGYYIGVYDQATGNVLVDAMTDFPQIQWDKQGSGGFSPNKVVSLGILKDPGSGYYGNLVIYDTQLK